MCSEYKVKVTQRHFGARSICGDTIICNGNLKVIKYDYYTQTLLFKNTSQKDGQERVDI